MALSVETGGIRLGAPVVPQLSPANALAGLKPLSFTGGLQTPLSFQAPKAWNIGSSHPEAITAGVASAAQSIMAGYKSQKELERDAKKLDLEERRFKETERHNREIEKAAFDRIDKVIPKGAKQSVDYSDYSDETTDEEYDDAYLPLGRQAVTEPPTETLEVSPELSGGLPNYTRDASESPLKGGVEVTDIVVPQPETPTENQVAALADVAPPVVAPPAVEAVLTSQPKQASKALELAAFPQPLEKGASVPKKEAPAIVAERRNRGELTSQERQATLLQEGEELPKDASGMPVIDPNAAVNAAKAARNPAPEPALSDAEPPQASPSYQRPALADQQAPTYGMQPTAQDQKVVHNSPQEAQAYALNFNKRFAGSGYTASVEKTPIPNSKSRLTGRPQWRVSYEFDPEAESKKAEKKVKEEAAAASLDLQKKRVQNVVETKLQSRARAWERDPNAKIMETRRDAMARFLVAAERAMNKKLMSETSRPVVDQEMKDLFVQFATGRVPTEGQYHEINTAFRGLPDYIKNKFQYGATGQTLNDKDITTIRDMMLETYNSSARNINNALAVIKSDLEEDFPELSKKKHPTPYAILRLPHEIEEEAEAAKQTAELLWNNGEKEASRSALKEFRELQKELEKARKEGASNVRDVREFKYGQVPGWHSWRFGGAPENQVTTSE